MKSLLEVLRDIFLLRRGPQDLPHSPGLLLGTCAVTLATQFAMALVLGVDGNVLLAGIIGLTFNLGVLYLLLGLRHLRNRFVQAGSALLLCGLVFTLLSLPIALIAGGQPPPTPETITPLQAVLGMISLPIVIWYVVVNAHVLRHSLDLPFLGGLLIAIAWLILQMRLGVAMGSGPAAA